MQYPSWRPERALAGAEPLAFRCTETNHRQQKRTKIMQENNNETNYRNRKAL